MLQREVRRSADARYHHRLRAVLLVAQGMTRPRYMFSVSRIHLITPHPFLPLPLGEGIGVRDIDAEFAEDRPVTRELS